MGVTKEDRVPVGIGHLAQVPERPIVNIRQVQVSWRPKDWWENVIFEIVNLE